MHFTSTLIHFMPAWIGSLSFLYLVFRIHDFWKRQKRSIESIPFPLKTPPPVTQFSPQDRARGLLLGIAIGDATGLSRESIPPWITRLLWGDRLNYTQGTIRFMRKPGVISDDTQHTLIIAKCLSTTGELNTQQLSNELQHWFGERIGPGVATQKAVKRLKKNQIPSADPKSQGNGAAMRIAPITIIAKTQKHLQHLVHSSASLTHQNSEAIEGAYFIATLMRWCLDHRTIHPESICTSLKPSQQSQEKGLWLMRLKLVRACLEDKKTPAHEHLAAIGTSGWVFHTCFATLYLLLYFKTDWKKGLVCLYKVGQDTDTIGALYCACVGALVGQRAFDQQSLLQTQGTHLLIEQADKLSMLTQSTEASVTQVGDKQPPP